jgi:DNA-binding response OmpR family regulator
MKTTPISQLIILEDEPVLRREIAEYLRDQGWQVSEAGSIGDFERQWAPAHHNLAIVDLGLPDGDGLDLIAKLRASGSPLGIIILTARGAEAAKLKGLSAGADHYLPKSVSFEELAATALALARRLGMGGVSLDWVLVASGRKLLPPGHGAIDLSPQDYAVLRILMSSANRIVSRRDIVEALGNNYLTTDPARLDSQMRRLRKKVGEATGLDLPLKTLRNEGYQFYSTTRIDD